MFGKASRKRFYAFCLAVFLYLLGNANYFVIIQRRIVFQTIAENTRGRLELLTVIVYDSQG